MKIEDKEKEKEKKSKEKKEKSNLLKWISKKKKKIMKKET